MLQDLTGQNSNDSSSGGGPAPGTPNSGGMRPTPSPTGSTGSRSMSPAVGGESCILYYIISYIISCNETSNNYCHGWERVCC